MPENIEPVAVFVNADVDFAQGKIEENGYTHVQLHGNESPEYCRNLMSGVKIIKAFQINKEFDFASLQDYEQVCDYYLFDTSGAEPGGTGKKFDWDLLQKYEGKKPFFLSGGIGEDDVPKIKSLVMPALFAIDVNSKFEIEPAVKDSGMLGVFIKAIRNE
ncbi:MAG TPA: phosphoribosylanthranilate isomerase [Flavobacteriales bacterium]|nr:phosphoribosylanthranilate isomerase [Flavobacteriales bacterium]